MLCVAGPLAEYLKVLLQHPLGLIGTRDRVHSYVIRAHTPRARVSGHYPAYNATVPKVGC